MKTSIKKSCVAFLLISGCYSGFSQLITNDGVAITVENGITLTVNGGITIQTNGTTDGTIDNDGIITLTGDWANNSTQTGEVFINPDANGTVSFLGSSAQQLGGTESTAFESLTVNNSSATGITLTVPATVSQTLTLTDGIVFTTPVNLLTIADNATASSGSNASFVDGPLAKAGDDAFVFPVGDQTVWARLGISAPTVSSTFIAEYLFAEFSDRTPSAGIDNVSDVESWVLNRTGSGDVTVTLYYEDAARSNITDFVTADIVVARYNQTAWEAIGPGTVPTNPSGSITSNVESVFNYFTFGSLLGNNSLPVTLVSFEGQMKDEEVTLEWTTAQEINNDYFEVQRSYDGLNYQPVGVVEGNGSISEVTTYSFSDNTVNYDFNSAFYRLKQVDFDGAFEIHSPILVELRPISNAPFMVTPTIVTDSKFNVQWSPLHQPEAIRILDSRGILIQEIKPVSNSVEVNYPFESGIYFIQFVGFETGAQRIVVRK